MCSSRIFLALVFSHPPCLPQTLHRETSLSIAAPRQPNLSARCAPSPILVGPSPLTHPGAPDPPAELRSVARVPRLAGLGWGLQQEGGGQAGAHAVGVLAGPVPQGTSASAAELPPALGWLRVPRAVLAQQVQGHRGDAERAGALLLLCWLPIHLGHQLCRGSWGVHPFPPQLPVLLLAQAQSSPVLPGPARLNEGPCQRAGCRPAQPQPLGPAGQTQPCRPPPVLLKAPVCGTASKVSLQWYRRHQPRRRTGSGTVQAGLRRSPEQGSWGPRASRTPGKSSDQQAAALEHPPAGAKVALGAPSLAGMQVSAQRLGRDGSARSLRAFVLIGVSRWCRSVGWMG